MGTALMMAPILKDFSEHFEITLIDPLGWGASGRPEFRGFTPELLNEFFVFQLRTYMQLTGYDKEPFSFMCHSMGCYISIQYAAKYPQNIE
jgi:pimeloyl-ACP methyl ester carboxylesterase